MKKFHLSSPISFILAYSCFLFSGCERPIPDDLEPAKFPSTSAVFIDGFSGGLEYRPFAGSKLDAFAVDDQVFYDGTASMRFDVPNFGDPEGSFAGAIFPDYGGRDLTGYDALTFYAKATKGSFINEIGFGNDFGENKHLVVARNLSVSTAWKKYTIPIPDPSKLTREFGAFWYAEGPENGEGYSFWIDELQFENLGTIAQPRPVILDGEEETESSFIGIEFPLTGLKQTFNLADGTNRTIEVAPAYYDFQSEDERVAEVSEDGFVSIVGDGSTTITAILGGVQASGALTVESLGVFTAAPTPTRNAADVVSLFSDTYTNVPTDYYNGFFLDGYQTTLGGTGPGGADITINGNGIINYTRLNFVAIGTFLDVPTLNLSEMTHLHVDIQVQESVDPGDFIRMLIINSVGTVETQGSYTITSDNLTENEWASIDIPLDAFVGLANRTQVGLLFFISDNTISNILVDNVYYYKE